MDTEVKLFTHRGYFISNNASTELCYCFFPSSLVVSVAISGNCLPVLAEVYLQDKRRFGKLVESRSLYGAVSAMTTRPQTHTQAGRCYGDVKCKRYKMAVVEETS